MDISVTTNILIDDILKDNIIPNKSYDICKKSVLILKCSISFSLHNIPFTSCTNLE